LVRLELISVNGMIEGQVNSFLSMILGKDRLDSLFDLLLLEKKVQMSLLLYHNNKGVFSLWKPYF